GQGDAGEPRGRGRAEARHAQPQSKSNDKGDQLDQPVFKKDLAEELFDVEPDRLPRFHIDVAKPHLHSARTSLSASLSASVSRLAETRGTSIASIRRFRS